MKIALQKERSHSIGEPFAVWGHLAGASTGNFRFAGTIELDAKPTWAV